MFNMSRKGVIYSSYAMRRGNTAHATHVFIVSWRLNGATMYTSARFQ